jgi:hypothetical protein
MTLLICEDTEQFLFTCTHSSSCPTWSAFHFLMVSYYECARLVVCFLEQTFTFLIHQPLEEDWDHEDDWFDTFFGEGFLVATKPQTWLFPRRNLLLKIISMGTDSDCPALVRSRCKPSLPWVPCFSATEKPSPSSESVPPVVPHPFSPDPF